MEKLSNLHVRLWAKKIGVEAPSHGASHFKLGGLWPSHLTERVQLSRPVENPRAGGASEGEVEGVEEWSEWSSASSCQSSLRYVEEAAQGIIQKVSQDPTRSC